MKNEDAIRRKDVLRRLYTASFLCACFIVVEVVGGLLSRSLAVLSVNTLPLLIISTLLIIQDYYSDLGSKNEWYFLHCGHNQMFVHSSTSRSWMLPQLGHFHQGFD